MVQIGSTAFMEKRSLAYLGFDAAAPDDESPFQETCESGCLLVLCSLAETDEAGIMVGRSPAAGCDLLQLEGHVWPDAAEASYL